MVRKKRRKFSLEFKREAVRIFESGQKTISVVAQELGLHVNVLGVWEAGTTNLTTCGFMGAGRCDVTCETESGYFDDCMLNGVMYEVSTVYLKP